MKKVAVSLVLATCIGFPSYAQGPVDVSVVAKLPKLRSLNVSGSAVVNGAAIPASVRVSKDKKTTGL